MSVADSITRLNAALEGRYRIESELGEGGMATVYLADDTKHERKVALKVLKPELAAVVGAERFLAEIKTTANLSHPHILPLFDSGEADGFLFYVMPHVEGESLRDRLDREHQLPVEDAVQLAKNLAEALDYAHRKGVIHRDIKPANVLLLDGKPVISDFGIALAVGTAGQGRMTETGLSMGTPHYMSPEQATGDQGVGPPADVYALGCVLYEMLVGEPPYTGGTAQAILGKIIAEAPPAVTRQRKSVPPNVEAAILRALEKVPADRFTTARDLKRGLEDPSFRVGSGAERGAGARSRRAILGLAAALAVMTGLALWGWGRGAGGAPPYQIVALDLSDLPEPSDVALSPSGKQVVAVASDRLWIRDLSEFSFRELPNTSGAASPAWSPDGEWIAFGSGAEIRKIHRSGAPVSTVMRLPEECGGLTVCGPSWTDDGRIIAASGYSDLLVAPENGGPATPLLERDQEHFHRSYALPGGAVILTPDKDVGQQGIRELWDGETRRPLPGLGRPFYAAGFVFYNDDQDIWALEYSAAERGFVGDPVFVASRLRVVGASEDGSLLAVSTRGMDARSRELTWIDHAGNNLEPVTSLPDGDAPITSPSMARNGRLAYVDGTRIWTLDPRGAQRPIPVSEGVQDDPAWSPDGRTLYFSEREPGLSNWASSVKRLDLESGEVSVMTSPGYEMSASADGRWLTYLKGISRTKRPVVDTSTSSFAGSVMSM